ncbi:uncharacterized protein MELLADRAFT_108105 [Melampsora larici-populina 98AG31]|uniref:Uncharacterized protein n=1 Tax=Melampsora larici-populina (strain 98AG31 / pathotype 3-4-7) TaxID=747676 RepID=F4RRZ9_MELLP|nr:uncharacterized protein MELLADRAFT_108105 [Melampsora larici-populina 98AG31]EGG04769.1 hypothetical protein MELLADRAFT_108105 [Melampsora larici-populina 98AG31]
MKKIIINLDWDETITSKDTTSLISISLNPKNQERFHQYTNEYLRLLKDYEERYKDERNDLNEEKKFLEGFKVIEEQIMRSIEKDEYFKNNCLDLVKSYEQVEFNKGWDEFFLWFVDQTTHPKNQIELEINIISCSWSSNFIKHSLNYHDYDPLKFKSIRSNEINRKDGKFEVSEDCKVSNSGIKTSLDKLNELKNIISFEDLNRTKTVYVGDSLNDLMCLLESDLGIIIGNNSKLKSTCDKLKINVMGFDCFCNSLDQIRNQKLMVRVDDWFEVLKVLNKFLGN